MQRLGLTDATFVEHLLPASLAAALVCAAVIALLERRRLSAPVDTPGASSNPAHLSGCRASTTLVLAAAAAAVAPVLGISPVWPFAAIAGVSLVSERARVRVPWRVAVQVVSLLVVFEPLAARLPIAAAPGAPGLLYVLVAVSFLAALGNNPPAGAAVASLPLSAAGSLGAMLGLSVGSLATPHGSVATLIAAELADPDGRIGIRRPLAVAAAAGVVAAGLVAVLTL